MLFRSAANRAAAEDIEEYQAHCANFIEPHACDDDDDPFLQHAIEEYEADCDVADRAAAEAIEEYQAHCTNVIEANACDNADADNPFFQQAIEEDEADCTATDRAAAEPIEENTCDDDDDDAEDQFHEQAKPMVLTPIALLP